MILIPKYKNIIEVDGSLSLILTDTVSNKIRQELYVPNLVVYTGKSFIASRMVGTTASVMSHMGIGTSSTAEVAGPTPPGDTALGAELTVAGGYTNYSRAGLTTSSSSNNSVTYVATFGASVPSAPSGGAILREAGIFNSSTIGSGTMLCRTTFPIVTKLPADALTITWNITIS